MTSLGCVITTCDDGDAVVAAVDSVLQQRRVPDEIVLADDASGDDDRSIVAEVARRSGCRVLLRPERLGASANRDDALRSLGTDLVTYLDGDDRFLPEKLEAEEAALGDRDAVAFSDVRVMMGRRVHAERDLRPMALLDPLERFRASAARELGSLVRNPTLPRHLYVASGGFRASQRMFNDWDWLLRLEALDVPFVHSGVVGYEYRRNDRGLSASNLKVRMTSLAGLHYNNRRLLVERLGWRGTAVVIRRSIGRSVVQRSRRSVAAPSHRPGRLGG